MRPKSKYRFSIVILSFFIIVGCNDYEINLSQIQSVDNKEVVAYFSDVGFTDKNKLRKWKTDIYISVSGKYDEYNIQSIDEFIEVFNELSNDIKMKRTEKGGNIKVEFGEDKNFNPKGYVGLCSKRGPLFSYEITSAKILIAPILSSGHKRKTIHHEMSHAVGLNDSRTSYNSYNMMAVKGYNSIDEYEKQNQSIQFSELDKYAIQILYNSNIEPGLRKDEFIKHIKY